MKLPIIIVALVVMGAGTTVVYRDTLFAADTVATIPPEGLYTVRRGLLNVTLTENGTLVAKESRKINADVKGQAKITFLVEEGSQVEEGEVVCRFDVTDFEDQLEQRELEVVTAEADLYTAQTNLEIQEADNAASIEKADVALEKAEKELERYIEGDAPKEERSLNVAIKEAQTNHTRAKKTHDDSKLLEEKGYINRSQLEEDEISLERAVVQLEGAKQDLELFDKYTRPMTTTEREVAVRDAQRDLDIANKRAQSNLRQKEVEVEKTDKRLSKLQDQVTELTEQIEKMALEAPSPGLVIYGDPRRPWERDRIRVGGDVWGHMTVLTIPDLRVMQVKLHIHEADINKIEQGQTAKVTMDTYPGLVIDAEVSKIAAIAGGEDPWDDDPEVKKFAVELTLQTEDDVELKPGISAKAEIFIDRREDVIFVPLQCVFLEEGEHWCYVVKDDVPSRRKVKPGLSNDSSIEILEGLDEGEQVLLYNPNLPASPSESPDEGDGSDAGGEGMPVAPATPRTS